MKAYRLDPVGQFSFFFSSRRRHTRYIGDWSSDVCSSDLRRRARIWSFTSDLESDVRVPLGRVQPYETWRLTAICAQVTTRRSEERRVGKACRARRWRGH